jgi:hypothetical protein
VVPSEIDNITTPEGSQYTDCRPVWCAVPKMLSLSSSMDVMVSSAKMQFVWMSVSIYPKKTLSSSMNVNIS